MQHDSTCDRPRPILPGTGTISRGRQKTISRLAYNPYLQLVTGDYNTQQLRRSFMDP
jgi:hypothetical protein